MKFVLEEKDKNYINRINKDIEDGYDPPLFVNECRESYYIEFECLDIAKANSFVGTMLTRNPEERKEIEENLGIKIKSINYCCGDSKVYELKEYLKTFLEQLENM